MSLKNEKYSKPRETYRKLINALCSCNPACDFPFYCTLALGLSFSVSLGRLVEGSLIPVGVHLGSTHTQLCPQSRCTAVLSAFGVSIDAVCLLLSVFWWFCLFDFRTFSLGSVPDSWGSCKNRTKNSCGSSSLINVNTVSPASPSSSSLLLSP